MGKINNLSMRAKILLSCIGCMIVALLIQTFLFQRSSSRIIYAQASEISRTTLNNLQDDLYAFNKGIENSLIKIYNDKEFIRDISFGPQIGELQSVHNQVAYDLAYSAFNPSQNLTCLYVYTLDHELIGSYQHAQTPKYFYPENIYDGSMECDQDLIKAYLGSDNRTMLITSYYNTNRETTLVRYVLKLYKNTSELVGYVVCDVDPKPFSQLMQKYRYSEGQIIWLQPAGDSVAVQTDVIGTGQSELFQSIGEQIKTNRSYAETVENSTYELYHAREHKYNFIAHALMPKAVLALNQTVLFQNTVLILVLIVLAFSFLFVFISNGLTKPLTYMVESMNRIKKGEMDLRLKITREDELGILGREFNDMLDETERLLKREYEAKALADDAKYKALQAQVNPHFLYNTLDTMSGIAASQNCPAVGTMCRALSNLFRYSLHMQSPYATLEEEILHIKNYMYIVNVRTNNSIQLQFQIDSESLKYQVPRISIQPLVENAIQHGLKNKRGDKLIVVGAEIEDGLMRIWVEDNGVGMDAPTINQALERSVSDTLERRASIGIHNINARMKLLYGQQYGVKVESVIGQGSRVMMQFPVKAGKEGE